jgi:thymidylate synthase ThyX
VLAYVKKQVPQQEGQSEKAWERSCGARRFDAIRYLLPTCTKTSLGWTVNARQLAHGIQKLLSHPLSEMNLIGELLKSEGKKALPSLLLYAEKNKYMEETPKDLRAITEHVFEQTQLSQESVTLAHASHDVDRLLIASILYKYAKQPMKDVMIKVDNMSDDQKEHILDTYLGKMSPFDSPMRAFENVEFLWDITMDYGAFRDLQRHRMCTQIPQPLSTDLGYETPPDIIGAGVQEQYDQAMQKVITLYNKLRDEYPEQAQYIVPLAFNMRYLYKANLRQVWYMIKLRSTPQGHFSYRRIARLMYNEMKKRYPLIAKYLQCNMGEDELGRLQQEIKVQQKIEQGRGLKDMLKD